MINTKRSLKTILAEENLNLSNNPRGTDKGDYKSYVDKYYEIEFEKIRNSSVKLLEIGFRHGASLALWSNYFKDIKILGLDNSSDHSLTENLPVNENWLASDNITTRIGNAYDSKFAKEVIGPFDVIIDDGPHSLESQLIAMDLYHNKLSKNGVMIIEDIQKYGGLILLFFILKVPFKFALSIKDLRTHKWSHDNILLIVRRCSVSFCIINRLKLILQICFYFVVEPPLFIFRKLFRF